LDFVVIFHPLQLKTVWALVIFSVVILRPEPEEIVGVVSEGRLLPISLLEFLTFTKVVAEAPAEFRDHRERFVSLPLAG
jgi:hypothetical protein